MRMCIYIYIYMYVCMYIRYKDPSGRWLDSEKPIKL